ncbi:MAG: DUF2147 domain-containing protein [Bacteroidales bacterium]|jgi:uncharacterized protein (DUF2147 family)|nr:DUF2147 domain-containing protein [Bacteroidales bacterium]
MKRLFVICAILLASVSLHAQVNDMLGDWYTVDDKSGEKLSVVNIYKGDNGLYYGKIEKLLKPDAKTVCTECPGEDKGKSKIGLVIIRDMKADKDKLTGGRVLDPDTGKFYYAKISLKDGQLVLRGSLDKKGLLGRSQTWVRK